MNILLNQYNFHEDWAKQTLKNIIREDHKVLIIPFSFRNDLKNQEDWKKSYDSEEGRWYHDVIKPFVNYGIQENTIEWLNYFTDSKDSAKKKINRSDIQFFTGGLPDKMMERLDEFDLIPTLNDYKGIIIGSSAGAMIQFEEYHITPDCDYDQYSYQKGLSFFKDFEIEVHYEGQNIQLDSIHKYRKERNKPVYAICDQGGIVVDKDSMTFMGTVTKFE